VLRQDLEHGNVLEEHGRYRLARPLPPDLARALRELELG
jgi:hypothetical protein